MVQSLHDKNHPTVPNDHFQHIQGFCSDLVDLFTLTTVFNKEKCKCIIDYLLIMLVCDFHHCNQIKGKILDPLAMFFSPG